MNRAHIANPDLSRGVDVALSYNETHMYLGFAGGYCYGARTSGQSPWGGDAALRRFMASKAASGGKTLGSSALALQRVAGSVEMDNAPQDSTTTATRIAVEEFEAAVLQAAERAAAQAAEVRALEEAVEALRKK